MSSHHIIRDEQEPALYIHAADNFTLEAMGDLLEWSPTVLVSPAALKKVVDFGMKVDAVPGTSFSPEQEELLKAPAACPTSQCRSRGYLRDIGTFRRGELFGSECGHQGRQAVGPYPKPQRLRCGNRLYTLYRIKAGH